MNVILGAGMAGMGAYYCDNSFEVFEREAQAGGLCGRFEVKTDGSDQVFYFDKAVHLSFTEDPIVKEAFSQSEQNVYQPIPHSWFHNLWLQHPAQNNLYPLSAEFKTRAVKGFINRKPKEQPQDFKEWLLSQWGEVLYNELFKPYNEKYWCTDLEQMDINWVGGRFYLPTIDEVLYGSYTDQTPNTYYAKEMRYPKRGGYRGYISHVAERAEAAGKIHYGHEVKETDVAAKTIKFSNGATVRYDTLLSSIPLPAFIKTCSHCPDEIRRCAEELEYSKIAIVSFGFNRKIDCRDIWFYIYDTDILAARAYVPSLKSSDNVPEGCSSIQFEIYFNSRSEPCDSQTCIQNCIYALKKMGIATEDDIIAEDYRIIEYGNVIFKKHHETQRSAGRIISWLEENGVVPIGRFGRWEYLWSDQAFLSGYEGAKRVKER